ncbi:hypothetical protein QOZ88_12295 [Blastococcus sp. BMG 814]|uniref:Uncharacterized protein n=1 Tax=Blastococcus carthaginiensis TaxID=3050034 RepID=A0ABT9ICX8_9ACTN|nr:hypothetical protein [Blastococcus carthaginiensis]MDP5183421.1 hypothetical protein [Blastococcus carthaginiensis]
MTEPTAPRPVPGPYRPGPAPVAVPGAPSTEPRPGPVPEAPAEDRTTPADDGDGRLDGLDELPVSEHVAVFEAEHARLQRELGTIDPR